MQCEFTKEELIVLDLILINRLCGAKLYLEDHPVSRSQVLEGGHEDTRRLEESIARLDALHKKLNMFLEELL